MLTTAYLFGCLLAICASVAADCKLHGRRLPQQLPRGPLFVLTALLWPLVLVGLVQIACFAGLALRLPASKTRQGDWMCAELDFVPNAR
jgi:hypothetical protein